MKNEIKKIVVTGGSGYIGSHIIYAFEKAGHHVVSLDKRPCNGLLPATVKSYIINLQNYSDIINLFISLGEVDCIIHCAGELGINKSYTQKELFYQQNVLVTDNIINAAIQRNVKNFIFASSAAVYADMYSPVTTQCEISKAPSPYSLTKIICEERIRRAAEYANMNYILFRYFNVIGCTDNNLMAYQQYMKKSNLIPNFITASRNKEMVRINGNHYNTKDGTCVRDYVNVCDLAILHLKAYEKMKSKQWNCQFNGVYNAGSGCPYSVIDVRNIINSIMGDPLRVVIDNARQGDAPYLCADISDTLTIFDWIPTTTVKDTIVLLMGIQDNLIKGA